MFFERVRDLLTPGGAAALQTITIDEARFDDYRRKPDFIQRYIFPGGMLPSPERFCDAAKDRGPRPSRDPIHFGASYAKTLAGVAHALRSRRSATCCELGFDERFVRMWRYYLAYCRAGFDAETIDVMQVRLEA